MQILADSNMVLQEIYKLLNEGSYCLVVNIDMDSMASKLNISTKRLNVAIHYLIESGYIKGDFAFNRDKGSSKEVTILPLTINKIEHGNL